MDLGCLIETIHQFAIFKKNLLNLDYAIKNKINDWTREFEEHPTNPYCLVYCD